MSNYEIKLSLFIKKISLYLKWTILYLLAGLEKYGTDLWVPITISDCGLVVWMISVSVIVQDLRSGSVFLVLIHYPTQRSVQCIFVKRKNIIISIYFCYSKKLLIRIVWDRQWQLKKVNKGRGTDNWIPNSLRNQIVF